MAITMNRCEKCPNEASSPTAKYCADCRRALQVEQGRKQGKRRSKEGPGFWVEPTRVKP